MEEKALLKWTHISQIIWNVAGCAHEELVLVGGTALALFHLLHRISIDIDFVPLKGKDEVEAKRKLKGCLSKKGYRTTVGAHWNQFIINFEDTAIKVEVFQTEHQFKKIEKKSIGGETILAASIDDIYEMKVTTYAERKEVRDLYDIYCIAKIRNEVKATLKKILQSSGKPQKMESLKSLLFSEQAYNEFQEAISDASKELHNV